MFAVLLTVQVIIVIALIAVVLIQRSEGGALGIGGGGGGMMSSRGTASFLTRATSILAACFFANSVGLALVSGADTTDEDLTRELTGQDIEAETRIESGTASAEDLADSLDFGTELETDPEAEAETGTSDTPAASDEEDDFGASELPENQDPQ